MGEVDRILVDVIAEIRRIEAITDRALTDDEVTTLKAGAFFRRIVPNLFGDKDTPPTGHRPPWAK